MLQVFGEIIAEIFGVILLRLVGFNQVFQGFDVIVIQQFVNVDVLADLDRSPIEHADKMFVGLYKTTDAAAEGMEAAFQTLDQNAFHKATDITLLLALKLRQLLATAVIQQRYVTCVTKTLK